MDYIISMTAALMALAVMIGSFAFVERRLVSAIQVGKLLAQEIFLKKSLQI